MDVTCTQMHQVEHAQRATALSQTCLCVNRKKKPLSQRTHRCECFFFFKQKTAYEIGLGIPAEPLFRSIDHRPEGDEKWFLENEKTVTQFCRKLAAERP